MRKIMKYFSAREKAMIAVSLMFIFFQVWLDLKLPDYMSEITTLVETKGSRMSDILMQGEYMLVCAFGSMAASMVVGYLAAKVAAGLSRTLRGKIYDKTLDFNMEEINRFSAPSLINRTTNDITQIQTLVAMGLQAIVKAPILAVWAIIKIAGQSWEWTAATAVAVFVLIIMLAATLIFAVPRYRRIQGLTDNLNRITREHLSGIRVVRAYNAEGYQRNKFEAANGELTQTNLTANRVMAIMSPGMTFINSGLTLAVYWIGAYIINAAGISSRLHIFSQMVVFSNYAMQVIMAFMLLNIIFILLPRAQVSARRIAEVIDTEVKIKDGDQSEGLPDHEGTIEFKNVSFRYPDAGDCALKDISFSVGKGETLAIIGATSSGKTTLVNLIPRFYDSTEGEILIDGINVKQYKQNALHDKIGYVLQKAVLFSGTVNSNISYGAKTGCTADRADIKNAADVSQSTEFIENMDGAFEAEISQGGTNVSGGQKQRLAIARAIARDPEILIFDDSFSALDYKTDRNLRDALNEKSRGTTKLIVAQRIGTIRHADQIIVLEHGHIAGIGSHEKLMKNCAAYQEIAESQLSKEEIENV